MSKQLIFSVLVLVVITGCRGGPKDPPPAPAEGIRASVGDVQVEPPVDQSRQPIVTTEESKQTAAKEPPRMKIVPDEPKITVAVAPPATNKKTESDDLVRATCTKIANKLASVGFGECMGIGLYAGNGRSNKNVPILEKTYPPKRNFKPLGRVLLMGGVHGDELTSVSAIFKWMRTLEEHHTGRFHWIVAPLVNPDGVLRRHSIRGNENGVDLNRNFPTPFWETRSKEYWLNTKKNPRRYPGPKAASEPETRWAVQIIESFQPDVIVSVHAPLELVDYDSIDRSASPNKIGILYRNLMGVFPGSLGNYAGVQRNIPVITLELPHSWVMPKPTIISHMWRDLVYWLNENVPDLHARRLAQKSAE